MKMTSSDKRRRTAQRKQELQEQREQAQQSRAERKGWAANHKREQQQCALDGKARVGQKSCAGRRAKKRRGWKKSPVQREMSRRGPMARMADVIKSLFGFARRKV